MERPSGPDTYTGRLKAHPETSSYREGSEIYPLQHDGTRHEVFGRAYILVTALLRPLQHARAGKGES